MTPPIVAKWCRLAAYAAAVAIIAGCAGQAVGESAVPAWASERVAVPWQAGEAALFEAGTPAESGRRADRGSLPVTIVRPDGPGPFPFVVLLHGCGGLYAPAMWAQWVEPWAELLKSHGIATAVVDSLAPRGVSQVCRFDVAAWAQRRADDAHSVRVWLADQPYADASRIAVMGMSNGGRTVLSALRADRHHAVPFRIGIALYPGCQSDVDAHFDAPLLILIGRGDRVTSAPACEALAAHRPANDGVTLVVYPDAPHTFDMKLPGRTILGMRLGYDADATADARRRVIAFLIAHGLGH